MQQPKAQNRDLSSSAVSLVNNVVEGGVEGVYGEGVLMASVVAAGAVEYRW